MASEFSINNPHLYTEERLREATADGYELVPDHERPKRSDFTEEQIGDLGEDIFDLSQPLYRPINFREPEAGWDPDAPSNAVG